MIAAYRVTVNVETSNEVTKAIEEVVHFLMDAGDWNLFCRTGRDWESQREYFEFIVDVECKDDEEYVESLHQEIISALDAKIKHDCCKIELVPFTP